jgi:hypothetical protein
MEDKMEDKIKISVNKYSPNSRIALGMSYIFNSIINSENFDVSFHEDYLDVFRGGQGSIIYVGNKKIYMDFWEYTAPTYSSEVFNANFDLIIKLQHPNTPIDNYYRYCKRKNLLKEFNDEQKKEFWNKIIPFTFFPNKVMEKYVGNENEIGTLPTDKFGFFCGKGWKCRHRITEVLKKENIECNYSDQAEQGGKVITDEEFLNKMKSSKFGIVLAGRSTGITDSKNRREIDYMMMKKPILMNYKPFYYNPMVEGRHYIFIDEKTDFKNIESMYNIDEIALNGHEWYLNNASRNGIANTFKQILIEKVL